MLPTELHGPAPDKVQYEVLGDIPILHLCNPKFARAEE